MTRFIPNCLVHGHKPLKRATTGRILVRISASESSTKFIIITFAFFNIFARNLKNKCKTKCFYLEPRELLRPLDQMKPLNPFNPMVLLNQ